MAVGFKYDLISGRNRHSLQSHELEERLLGSMIRLKSNFGCSVSIFVES